MRWERIVLRRKHIIFHRAGANILWGENMGQLEEMKVFVEIAKAESITGAAHRLNMAPSAVSRRLKDLESRLGVQLLIRTTRQVRLAEAGQLFLDNAIRILEDVQEAEEGVVANNEQLSGTLKISAPIGWGL